MPNVTDIRDTRVLIPRVRRAIEGLGIQQSEQRLEDDAVNDLIADCVANIILYTGGLFGHELQVVTRDSTYMAPTAWLVDPYLSEAEASLIAIEAQLSYVYQDLKALKVQETIRDEAEEWSYTLSATALNESLKGLRKQREEVLARIEESHTGLDAWVNTLTERDSWTDALIEPYIYPGGVGGQQLIADPRFD